MRYNVPITNTRNIEPATEPHPTQAVYTKSSYFTNALQVKLLHERHNFDFL